MPDFVVKQGQTQPIWHDQLTLSDGNYPPMVGSSVAMAIQSVDGSNYWLCEDVVIADYDTAQIYRSPTLQDSQNPGVFVGEWLLTLPDGSVMGFPTVGYLSILVQPSLGSIIMPIPYTPTTRELATYLMARTRDQYGNLIGDFTRDTSVTNIQAAMAIENATQEIAEEIGNNPPADFYGAAKRLVTMLAAANIELSYYPEQAAMNNSMYDKLMVRVEAIRTKLSMDVDMEVAIDEFGDSGQFGSFPAPSTWESTPFY